MISKLFRILIISICTILAILSCSCPQKVSNQKNHYDVIIVGGGLGGLTSGAKLARSGLKVLLVEQHFKVGGCNTSFERGEFNFDASLHQFSIGPGIGTGREILRDVGVLEKIELIRAPELARSIFPGLDFVTPNRAETINAAFKQRWPQEAKGIDGFFDLAETISDEMMELSELYRSNRAVAGFNKFFIPFVQPALFKWRNATLKEVLDHFLVDPKLKAVMAQYWIYMGPPPSKVWAPAFLLGFYSYVKNGAWQIKGSSQALADAFAQVIQENGSEIMTDTLVTKINFHGDDVQGITVEDGRIFTSKYVISSADPYQTYFKLIGRDKISTKLAKKLESIKPSNSLAGVYLGLDVEPSFWGIKEYEVFYQTSYDEDAMYEAMLEGRFDEGAMSLTFYTNLNDPFYAPKGKSVLVLNTYSTAEYWPDRGPEYYKLKEKMTDQLIALSERLLPGLRDHIVVKESMTPLTIEMFTLHKGGIPYGFDLLPEQYTGLGNKTDFDGLYLVGSWANLLHGTGGTILSGSKAARLIMDEEGLD